MLPTNKYTQTIGANQSFRLPVAGAYFKILSASGTVTVQSDFGKLADLTSGQGLEKTPFNYLLLTDSSGGSNTVTILIGDENFIDSSAQVTISGQQGTFGSLQKTITNASGTLLSTKANRRYLLVQNNDAAGILYVNLGGATATVLNGVRLLPGESLELQGYVPNGSITAIGSIASNANVVTVEG